MTNEQQNNDDPFRGLAMRGQAPDSQEEDYTKTDLPAGQGNADENDGADDSAENDEAFQSMEKTLRNRSHRNRITVSIVAIVLILAAVITAFLWPGWALKKNGGVDNIIHTSSSASGSQTVASPTISASPLPSNASELVKTVLPATVGAYARQSIKPTTAWESSQPIEEYVVTYSTGDKSKDITVTLAQWSTDDYALKQYQTVTNELKGKQLAQGNVSVKGAQTGSYVVKEESGNSSQAVVVEQNSSVLFQITGPKDQLTDFFNKFGY